MKKKIILFLGLMSILTHVTSAPFMEEELLSITVKNNFDVKIALTVNCISSTEISMYFNNTAGYEERSFLETIDPFCLKIDEDGYCKFKVGLEKFFEWQEIAIKNNVSEMTKDIPVDGNDTDFTVSYLYSGASYSKSYDLSLRFERSNNKSQLALIVWRPSGLFMEINNKIYFSEYQVEQLKKVLSEESIKTADAKIQTRKKQKDLFY